MPSVSLSITFVHCAQTAEDIDTIRRTFAVYLSVAQSQTFDGKLRPLKIAHCGIDQNGVYETTISLFRMVGSTIAESGRLPLRLPPKMGLANSFAMSRSCIVHKRQKTIKISPYRHDFFRIRQPHLPPCLSQIGLKFSLHHSALSSPNCARK